MTPPRCTYLGDGKTKRTQCPGEAVYRYPPRCVEHGGHLDFTERLEAGVWVPWRPVHTTDPRFPLDARYCGDCGTLLLEHELFGPCDNCLPKYNSVASQEGA